MASRHSDPEVFDFLTSDEETPLEIDYLTYGVFAFKKREWVKHFENENNEKPSPDQIENWISQLTDYDFVQMRDEAAEFFDASAREYLKDFIESEKKSAVDLSILNQVKVLTNPWRHFGVALLMAILAPIILGGAIFLFGLFHDVLPMHVTFGSMAGK